MRLGPTSEEDKNDALLMLFETDLTLDAKELFRNLPKTDRGSWERTSGLFVKKFIEMNTANGLRLSAEARNLARMQGEKLSAYRIDTKHYNPIYDLPTAS